MTTIPRPPAPDQSPAPEEIYNQGWLRQRVRHVRNGVAQLPHEAQPRLTGSRADAMSSPSWLGGKPRQA